MTLGAAIMSDESRERLAREHMEKARAMKTDTQEQIEEVMKHLSLAIEVKPLSVAVLLQRAHLATRIGRYHVAIADLTFTIQLEEHGIDRRRLAAAYGSRAAVYRKLNKHKESIVDYVRAADVEPDNGTWLYELGLVYAAQGMKALAHHFVAASLSEKVTGRMSEITRFRALTSLGTCKLASGDITGAVAVLTKGLEFQETAALHNLLGIAHFLRGEYEPARSRFERAVEMDHLSSEYHTNCALCLFQLGIHSEAFKQMEYAVIKSVENARYHFYRGNIALLLGLHAPAMTDVVKAIELDPQCASHYYSKALILVATQDYEEAMAILNKAIELNPTFRAAWVHSGLLHFLRKNLFEALQCFSRALELEEEDATVHECVGLVYFDIKYYDLSAASFTRCIDLIPDDPVLYFRRGTALLLCGDLQGAYDDLQKTVCKYKFRNPEVLNSLSVVVSKLGRHLEALELAKEAVALNSKNHRYLLQQAECHFAVRDYDAVLEDLANIVSLGYATAELYYLRGRSKYALRDFCGAADDLLQAATCQPLLNECSNYCYALGVAYLCSGKNINDAEKALTRAITSHSDPPSFFYDERAKARQKLGDTKGMLEDLNFMLQRDQSDPTVLLRRSLGYKALGLYDKAARDFEKAKTLNGAREVLDCVPYEKFFEIEEVLWGNEQVE
ncbi:TPR repeat, putative [Trypanosoma equiperdum]|uniref:Uncharacterized protein n=2 Tax=Trypanozoon TaxID=39700 RepID=Q57WP4_TRYB2|nr:hypothetical protein, conserved [Trypanosoma brucei brucei TREU927]AAX69948.1 hypothetical protein, conserved [Trypanosoma brucei]AAZ12221.1 hypothetical protein, conserved [Trypanosoma brucei brucei TREU927]SCU71954.1 TPR repeat, putative [Trypanosoma equiperdum]